MDVSHVRDEAVGGLRCDQEGLDKIANELERDRTTVLEGEAIALLMLAFPGAELIVA